MLRKKYLKKDCLFYAMFPVLVIGVVNWFPFAEVEKANLHDQYYIVLAVD